MLILMRELCSLVLAYGPKIWKKLLRSSYILPKRALMEWTDNRAFLSAPRWSLILLNEVFAANTFRDPPIQFSWNPSAIKQQNVKWIIKSIFKYVLFLVIGFWHQHFCWKQIYTVGEKVGTLRWKVNTYSAQNWGHVQNQETELQMGPN